MITNEGAFAPSLIILQHSGSTHVNTYDNPNFQNMKKLPLILIPALACCLAGCLNVTVSHQVRSPSSKTVRIKASGRIVSKTPTGINPVSAIEAHGIATVSYSLSGDNTTNVSVKGSDNVIDYLIVEEKNGTLIIKIKDNISIEGDHGLSVNVSSPHLKRAVTSGAVKMNILDNITNNNIFIRSSGVSEITMKSISGKNIEIETSGTSAVSCKDITGGDNITFETSGTSHIAAGNVTSERIEAASSGASKVNLRTLATNEANLTASGSSHIIAEGDRVGKVTANTSGAAEIRCHAGQEIVANASGASRIYYSGNAHHKIHTSGTAKVIYK